MPPLHTQLTKAGHQERRGRVPGDLLHAAGEPLELHDEQAGQARVGDAATGLVVSEAFLAPILKTIILFGGMFVGHITH